MRALRFRFRRAVFGRPSDSFHANLQSEMVEQAQKHGGLFYPFPVPCLTFPDV